MNAPNRRRATLREAKGEIPRENFWDLIDDVRYFVGHYEWELRFMYQELDKIANVSKNEDDTMIELRRHIQDIDNDIYGDFDLDFAIDAVSRTQEFLKTNSAQMKRAIGD